MSPTPRPAQSGSSGRSWSPARLLTAAALSAWAMLFWWMLLSGRTSLYLSDRTAWVVPLGAVLLTVAVAWFVATARTSAPEPIEPRAALSLALLMAPVVLIAASPPASLGAYAAGRRAGLMAAASRAGSTGSIARGRVELVDIAAELRSRPAMTALVKRAGSPVEFVGFVDRATGMPADEFYLTRFLVSCCAADAVSLRVRVVGAPPGDLRQDPWVSVSGRIYPLGREVLVHASAVTPVKRPERPYLNG